MLTKYGKAFGRLLRGGARAVSGDAFRDQGRNGQFVEQLDRVVIRFAGDSGDGMQLTGARFTSETAVLGNDLSTPPDFPAEIRAPAGSLPGVPVSRSTSPTTTSSRPETSPTFWWR